MDVSCFGIPALQAGHPALFVDQLCYRTVVDQQGALGGCGACQRQCQTRIVELPVPIFDTALQALRPHARYAALRLRSEEHTSELQSLMRISYAVFFLKKKTQITQ